MSHLFHKVKIKPWGVMENEFGLLGSQYVPMIHCKGIFTHGMECLLPSNRVIIVKTHQNGIFKWNKFNISSDMIE